MKSSMYYIKCRHILRNEFSGLKICLFQRENNQSIDRCAIKIVERKARFRSSLWVMFEPYNLWWYIRFNRENLILCF